MPLTFIDIERRKNLRIGIFFAVLLAVYAAGAVLVLFALLPPVLSFPPRFWAATGAFSLLAAAIHFWFSAADTVATVVTTLDARPPDRDDRVHAQFLNVMEELRVVTGGKRAIHSVVIPSLSLNALAAVDLRGNAVIGITEGLLSRLSRPQLEAVVAHEAHHILSGDCLETTVAASLFGSLSAAIEGFVRGGRGRPLNALALLAAWLLLRMSYLLNMFISRDRESRADAASVRMTRNPIALAETLHLLSRSWRGSGFIGSGLEMLCIVNPEQSALDETEGFWADLFSTHPPLHKRIDVLLRMVRVPRADLEQRASSRGTAGTESGRKDLKPYYALSPQQRWEGPFTAAELGLQPWLSPLTWITADADGPAERAWKVPEVKELFPGSLRKPEQSHSGFACPRCGQSLTHTPFEGTNILQCRFCSGILAENHKIARILARTGSDRPCSDRVRALAAAVTHRNASALSSRTASRRPSSSAPLTPCPKCGHPMLRSFYSAAYTIEVDRCGSCGHTWFDQDELEMLRCLVANRILPPAGP